MWQYIVLFILVIISTIIFDVIKDKKLLKLFYFFIFIFCSLLMGLRYKVGIDTYNYMDLYKYIPKLDVINVNNIFNYDVQPLFLIFLSSCKTFISEDFVWVQLFHSFFVNYVVFSFIKKYSSAPFMGIFFYFVTCFLYFNTEIIKESFAIAIFLLSYKYLLKKSWIKYYLMVLLGTLFHTSAILLILVPLILNLKLDKKFFIYWGICLIVFLNILYFTEFFSYIDAVNKFNRYMNQSEINEMNYTWNLLLFIQSSLLPLCALFICKKILEIQVQYEGLILFMVIIGTGALINGVIFPRFCNYYILYYVLILAEILKKYLLTKGSKFLITFFFIFFFFYYLYDFWSHSKYTIWIPYNSIFYPAEDPARNNLWKKLF